jgi:hypothetical protein
MFMRSRLRCLSVALGAAEFDKAQRRPPVLRSVCNGARRSIVVLGVDVFPGQFDRWRRVTFFSGGVG